MVPGAAAALGVQKGGEAMRLRKIDPPPPFFFAFPGNDNGERDQAVIEAELAEIRQLREKLEAWDPRSQALPLRVARIVSIVK